MVKLELVRLHKVFYKRAYFCTYSGMFTVRYRDKFFQSSHTSDLYEMFLKEALKPANLNK